MPVATPEEGMGAGRDGQSAVSCLHVPLALLPIAATQ